MARKNKKLPATAATVNAGSNEHIKMLKNKSISVYHTFAGMSRVGGEFCECNGKNARN